VKENPPGLSYTFEKMKETKVKKVLFKEAWGGWA
jgi:hypothetical protein